MKTVIIFHLTEDLRLATHIAHSFNSLFGGRIKFLCFPVKRCTEFDLKTVDEEITQATAWLCLVTASSVKNVWPILQFGQMLFGNRPTCLLVPPSIKLRQVPDGLVCNLGEPNAVAWLVNRLATFLGEYRPIGNLADFCRTASLISTSTSVTLETASRLTDNICGASIVTNLGITQNVQGVISGAYRPQSIGGIEPIVTSTLFGLNSAECIIVPGSGNKHCLERGEFGMSPYARDAFNVCVDIRQEMLPSKTTIELNHTSSLFELKKYPNWLLFPGPVANDLAALLLGYTLLKLDGNRVVPICVKNPIFPLSWDVGDRSGLGHRDGTKETVWRWDENGKSFQGALYGLSNWKTGKLARPRIINGYLRSDAIMIWCFPNPLHAGGRIVVVGGMHGYSLKAFFAGLNEILGKLLRDHDLYPTVYFQAIIPFSIDENRQLKPEWDGIGDFPMEVFKFEADDYLQWFATQEISH